MEKYRENEKYGGMVALDVDSKILMLLELNLMKLSKISIWTIIIIMAVWETRN